MKKTLSPAQQDTLLETLRTRFEKHTSRHKSLEWSAIETKLNSNPQKCWSLHEMEASGGEPDVIGQDPKTGEYIFMDCSPESPKGRRSCRFDNEAQTTRKENAPENNALGMASAIGIEILSEEQYRALQQLGKFDEKTSSWIQTPSNIRKLGGALFGDRRYDTVFTYHNGAQSYYAARGFRGMLKV